MSEVVHNEFTIIISNMDDIIMVMSSNIDDMIMANFLEDPHDVLVYGPGRPEFSYQRLSSLTTTLNGSCYSNNNYNMNY